MKGFAKTFIFIIMFSTVFMSCSKQNSPKKNGALQSSEKTYASAKKVVVARINDANVTMFDLMKEMNTIFPQYVKPGQSRDPKLDEKVKKEALDRLIYRELAVQDAIRQGLKVLPANLDEEMKRFKAAMKTEDAYRQYLENSSLSEEELKKQIERNMLVDMITEKEIFDKVRIDPEVVKNTYKKEKASYKHPSGKQMSFEEARPLIEEKLMTPLVQKREDEWVEGLRKAAKIEIISAQSPKQLGAKGD